MQTIKDEQLMQSTQHGAREKGRESLLTMPLPIARVGLGGECVNPDPDPRSTGLRVGRGSDEL